MGKEPRYYLVKNLLNPCKEKLPFVILENEWPVMSIKYFFKYVTSICHEIKQKNNV